MQIMFTSLTNLAILILTTFSVNVGPTPSINIDWNTDSFMAAPYYRFQPEVNQRPKLIYTIDTVVTDEQGKSQRILQLNQ